MCLNPDHEHLNGVRSREVPFGLFSLKFAIGAKGCPLRPEIIRHLRISRAEREKKSLDVTEN